MLNIFQEIFLVVFSILYGVILQSLREFQPFPWGNIFSKKELCKSNRKVQYSEQRIAICRIFLSLLILNFCPFYFFVRILFLLSKFTIYAWCLEQYWLEFAITIWCSFIGYSFYRFYHILAVVSPFRKAFMDREKALRCRGVHPDWKGHFCAAILYFIGYFLLALFPAIPNQLLIDLLVFAISFMTPLILITILIN